MDGMFNKKELASSSLVGGVRKYKGSTYTKQALSPGRMKNILILRWPNLGFPLNLQGWQIPPNLEMLSTWNAQDCVQRSVILALYDLVKNSIDGPVIASRACFSARLANSFILFYTNRLPRLLWNFKNILRISLMLRIFFDLEILKKGAMCF